MAHLLLWPCSSRSGHWPGLRLAFSAARSARHGSDQAPPAADLVHLKVGSSTGGEPLKHLCTPPARPPHITNPHSSAFVGPRVPPCKGFVCKRSKSFAISDITERFSTSRSRPYIQIAHSGQTGGARLAGWDIVSSCHLGHEMSMRKKRTIGSTTDSFAHSSG